MKTQAFQQGFSKTLGFYKILQKTLGFSRNEIETMVFTDIFKALGFYKSFAENPWILVKTL